jgi:hypothetical protein
MTRWYKPFWDPGISKKKSHGIKPSGVQVKTHAGPLSANEHDFSAPTACLVESAIVLQKRIN